MTKFAVLCASALLAAVSLHGQTENDQAEQKPLTIPNPVRQTLIGKTVFPIRESETAMMSSARVVPKDSAPNHTAPACLITWLLPEGVTRLAGIQVGPERHNPDGTCEMDFDVGVPDTPPPVIGVWPGDRSEAQSRISPAHARFRPMAVGNTTAWLKVSFEDVIGIELNHVITNLSWFWDETCAGSPGEGYDFWSYPLTGWYENWRRTRKEPGCTDVYAEAGAQYTNDNFCKILTGDPTQPATVSYHDIVRMHGNQYGGAWGEFCAVSTGGCASSFRRVVDSGQRRW